MKAIEAWEIDITAIHHNEAARFRDDAIQNLGIAGMSASHVDQHRDRALNVEQCVQFDGRSGSFDEGPRETTSKQTSMIEESNA